MKFGQYELLEPIAIGGMAEVFKGRVVAAEGFEKYVAIKRILPDLAADERFVKMLLTEARIHSALSHRNIVQIHDLGQSSAGEYFIVLEYVEGYDLRVITEQLGKAKEIIPEALSLYIAAEIADGLHFAHEMRGPDGQPLGLVHRDVTPSNVLISFSGEVKLSDFGLAKRRHDNSVVGSLKGNLVYMSPEQAMQAPLDRRTDIYSLGAMLFEMITGRRLREITDEIAGWSQVASGVVPSARRVRPDLPAPIERLLDVALAPNPADRFPDAAKFGAAIREALATLNIAVGASDLAALLSLIEPPRRSRTLMMEPSKVIRLGSEAQALGEAIAAPQTPAPVVAPGLTPAAPRQTDRVAVRYRDPSATPMVEVHPPAEGTDPMATPPPNAPLPPARTRGYTPRPPPANAPRPRSMTPPLGGGGARVDRMRLTPPNPRPGFDRSRITPPAPRPAVTAPRATPPAGIRPPPGAPPGDRLRRTPPPGSQAVDGLRRTPPTGAPPGDRLRRTPPTGGRPASIPGARMTPPAGTRPTPVPGSRAAPNPHPQSNTQPMGLPRAVPAGAPPPAAQVVRTTGPRPTVGDRGPLFRTPSYGVQRPSGRVLAIGPGGPSAHALSYNPDREPRQTARVELRGGGGFRTVLAVLGVLAIAGAAAVHFAFIPLDVLATWWTPAALSISTDPNGASLSLDGVSLGTTTPVTISVKRDRADHVVEAQLAGFRTARAIMRYDRSLGLSFLLPLEKDPNAQPPPPPAPQPPPPGGAAPAEPR
jgi:serine/threonine-protein kinase